MGPNRRYGKNGSYGQLLKTPPRFFAKLPLAIGPSTSYFPFPRGPSTAAFLVYDQL